MVQLSAGQYRGPEVWATSPGGFLKPVHFQPVQDTNHNPQHSHTSVEPSPSDTPPHRNRIPFPRPANQRHWRQLKTSCFDIILSLSDSGARWTVRQCSGAATGLETVTESFQRSPQAEHDLLSIHTLLWKGNVRIGASRSRSPKGKGGEGTCQIPESCAAHVIGMRAVHPALSNMSGRHCVVAVDSGSGPPHPRCDFSTHLPATTKSVHTRMVMSKVSATLKAHTAIWRRLHSSRKLLKSGNWRSVPECTGMVPCNTFVCLVREQTDGTNETTRHRIKSVIQRHGSTNGLKARGC